MELQIGRQRVRGLHLDRVRHKLPGQRPSGHDVSLHDVTFTSTSITDYCLLVTAGFLVMIRFIAEVTPCFILVTTNSYSYDPLVPCGNFLKKKQVSSLFSVCVKTRLSSVNESKTRSHWSLPYWNSMSYVVAPFSQLYQVF